MRGGEDEWASGGRGGGIHAAGWLHAVGMGADVRFGCHVVEYFEDGEGGSSRAW